MVCGGADCPGHISLCLNINTCGLGTNNRDGRWFRWVDWKAELQSWRFGKAPIRECDCRLANQTSVRRLRFRGQTHLLLKVCLLPTDITNVDLYSLLLDPSVFLHLSLFNTLCFLYFFLLLAVLPPSLAHFSLPNSLSPTSFHPATLPSPQSSLHHYPAAPPTWWERSCQELRVAEKATAFLRRCAALPGSH